MKLLDKLISLLLPDRCPFCNQPIANRNWCQTCESKVEPLLLEHDPVSANPTSLFYTVFAYQDCVRAAILRLKYYNRRDYKRPFARAMIALLPGADFDGVVSVPSEPLEEKEHPNTAELLARQIATFPIWRMRYIKRAKPKSSTNWAAQKEKPTYWAHLVPTAS